jgi:GH15 family glucan-1,4-alpha-glucosidase
VSRPLEDYALIGDTQTAALVARDTSMDWLCFPRFDSPACFAALLGTDEHGCWFLGPLPEAVSHVRRRYRPGSLVLETELTTATGVVRVVDSMPIRGEAPDVVRVVEGVSGRVHIRSRLVIRFDYGRTIPWVRKVDGGLLAIAGPDALRLQTPIPHEGRDFTSVADFEVCEGDRVPFVLTWFPSHRRGPRPVDALAATEFTDRWWREWSGRCADCGDWHEQVERSLITLKALTYAPTGGIVAAPTTSIPEQLGGVRNWDYRACWLRDSTFTLFALMLAGYTDEARSWRDWLLRAVAGMPSDMQILYGVAGERRMPEMEIPWLPGYENSVPVRIGNGAAHQFQLDVFGEVMDSLHHASAAGLGNGRGIWDVQRSLMDFLESAWAKPDEGIWEVRGGPRHFTHSKVMAWVAADRAVRSAETWSLPGPVDRWRQLRADIFTEVCREGVDSERGCFVQSYGSDRLDAALLLIPQVGFLPPEDPRVIATVDAINTSLTDDDGFVRRYSSDDKVPSLDGLPPGEGAFLACSFWMVDALTMIGRRKKAEKLFDRLIDLANDVGLLAEEYDAGAKRLVGNFPQAFSHVGLINSARNLASGRGPGVRRAAPHEAGPVETTPRRRRS